jgi:Alpha/beta hydrolase domain
VQRLFLGGFAATVLSLAIALPAFADVTRLEITSKESYGTFRPGEYVLWKGKVHGELSQKEAIPDLDKVKPNARGMVEYTSDIVLLMPATPSKGNGTLIVDVPNRGRVYGVALYNSPHDEPFESGTLAQGTGFLEDRGFALAEVSWELGKGAELPSFTDSAGKTQYVEGAGFAIMRDAADFFARAQADNPLKGAIKRTLASGKSQSGRFLKTFLLNGFNQAHGHRVFDGMHIFVSGSGLLPILRSSPGPESSGNEAPSFAHPEFRGVHEGPFTIGEIEAKLAARKETPPKIVMISSTTDFLSLRASMGRTGGNGTAEQPIPDTVRMYEIAGGSHAILLKSDCKLPRERLDWSPVSRATLLHLDRWVAANTAPPANRLMPLEPATGDPDVLAAPKHLPNAVIERPRRDADGNVLGGVRLPDVAVPLGVHAAQQDPKSFGCSLAGAFLPFSDSKLAERYKNRDDYVNRVRIAARSLEADGFLLPDDAAVIIAAAAATQAVK